MQRAALIQSAPAKLSRRYFGIADVVGHALFGLLLVFEVVRTLRHAMWRDEFVPFQDALNSPSLSVLLSKLSYQGHPALWYILVWLVTRITSAPASIQILHIGLAIGVWVLIYFWSPFNRLEKILLLLSYFIFWEYFVVSRMYVLIALIAFTFIIWRARHPRPELALWLLLGLLANVHMYAAIWSMVLAAMLTMEGARRKFVTAGGAAVFLLLLATAIITMKPPPSYALSSPAVRFTVERLDADLTTPVGAFVPFSIETLRNSVAFIMGSGRGVIPRFWNQDWTPNLRALALVDTSHPFRLALAFAAPIVICWVVARNWLFVLEFACVYLGIVLFENIFNFPAHARQHGIVFLAFIAAAWSAWGRQPPAIWSRWLFGVVLVINACGGVLSLASELQPFSEAYETAVWIKQNDFSDAYLIGSHDAQVSSVAAYLGRPIYYLECECSYQFGPDEPDRWLGRLPIDEFGRRLAKAVALAGQREPILIRDLPVTPDDRLKQSAPNLSATLLKSFTNASTDENFWIYRMNTIR